MCLLGLMECILGPLEGASSPNSLFSLLGSLITYLLTVTIPVTLSGNNAEMSSSFLLTKHNLLFNVPRIALFDVKEMR